MAGRILVVATPIGNLSDLSARAREAFERADLVACEDPRRTGQLLHPLGIKKPMVCPRAQRTAAVDARLARRRTPHDRERRRRRYSGPGLRVLRPRRRRCDRTDPWASASRALSRRRCRPIPSLRWLARRGAASATFYKGSCRPHDHRARIAASPDRPAALMELGDRRLSAASSPKCMKRRRANARRPRARHAPR